MKSFSYLFGKKEEYLSWALSEVKCPSRSNFSTTLQHLELKHFQYKIVLENIGKININFWVSWFLLGNI